MTDLGVYWGFTRLRFLDLIANRTRFLIGIGSYFIYVSVYAAVYRAIYAGQTQVGGLSASQAITYVAVAWVLRSLYTNALDREVTTSVRQGDVAVALLRPVDEPWSRLAGAAGEALVRASIFSLPAAVVIALVYPVAAPAGPMAALGFGLGAVLAFGVYAQLNLLVGISAVFTEHTVGVQRAKNAMVDLLGGVLIPLSFFPEWAQGVLVWLPFQAITYTPVAMYLGRMEVGAGLAVQLAWVVVLFVLVRVMWRRALDRLTVHGG
ncbi:ABC transporter permease [Deinococcus malanensis]|uniref:ABC transporter permease n=1 Tax=Deinococcus malanensis TaxID=1706855 RepID=A0ABQ2F3C3_9DEIO|nr:ABC-2 family transporter protein [Deinococcus malanensis]GGK43957.1 ABC transporter permease [Deinococcus malanensis]